MGRQQNTNSQMTYATQPVRWINENTNKNGMIPYKTA